MSLWSHLSEQITQHTHAAFRISSVSAVHSGCINQAYKISDGRSQYFVKLNSTRFAEMFEVEALALQELASSHSIKVPRTICYGSLGDQAYLVLEHLNMSGRAQPILQGRQLAAMHQVTQAQFGWKRDNTIGSTPQLNAPMNNWVDFWRERRLLPQLQLAQAKGYALQPVEQLAGCFQALFNSYQPQPSMLHGDLWGGNAAGLLDGTPVIFDPAFYYGDRETDIAMSHLFGGFEAQFYAAYNEVWPLHEDHTARRSFYNLYHIINHLNLFGSSYYGQAISLANKVLAEIR
jgi:fructosamine-3-kinase